MSKLGPDIGGYQFHILLGTEIDWQYTTTNETHGCLSTNGSCSWPRGKNLGGSSVHNGMMYVRGHARDYDDWEDMGNIGWRWSDVSLNKLNIIINLLFEKFITLQSMNYRYYLILCHPKIMAI